MSNHMDVDVLPALPSGPRGVAGGLLERLEREALAEQARLEALERGERDPNSSKANGHGHGQGHGHSNNNGMPTYVPGQKRSQQQQQQHMSPPSAVAAAPPVRTSSAPISATSTVKSHNGGIGATATNEPAASTSMQASTSSSATLGGASSSTAAPLLARDRSSSTTTTAAAIPNILNPVTASASTRPSSSDEAQPPPTKKIRVQPTVRMSFTFPPYPTGREPLAKQVPIFDIHNLAEKMGLLIPPEEELVEEASSSGGSDDEDKDDDNEGDNEGGDSSMQNATTTKDKPDETEGQRQLRQAIELARRQGRPVLAKKRILERDEGYDASDPFVDDSDLAMNEPKVQARPKVEGFIAIQGEVEVLDNNVGIDGKPKKGRKFGSINRPKVPMLMPDGSTKMVSEAIADKEGRKAAAAAASAASKSSLLNSSNIDGTRPTVPASSASASPAPQAPSSSSAAYRPSSSTAHHMSPGGSSSRDRGPGPSRSTYEHHSLNVTDNSTNNAALSQHAYNPNGPLMSRDAVSYSHLPSSSSSVMADQHRGMSPANNAQQTPPPPSNLQQQQQQRESTSSSSFARPSVPPSLHGSRTSPIAIDDDGDVDMSFAASTNGATAGPSVFNRPSSSSLGPVPQASSSTSTPQPQPTPPVNRPSTTHFSFDPSPQRNSEGKRIYETHRVSPELEAQLRILREAVSRESFVPRNRFPASVKPVLMDTALVAMRTGEYDANFFNIMPNIFPYNRFTMHKMIKREICEIRTAQLEEEIAGHVENLKKEVDAVIGDAVAAHNETIAKWWEEYVAWRKENGTYNEELTPADVPVQMRATDNEGPVKPEPKFRFTAAMRMHLFSIMSLNTEIVERQTDKAEVEDRDPPSAMNATKARYATLVQLWPEGWMASNQLSRELTQAKKRVQSMMGKEGA